MKILALIFICALSDAPIYSEDTTILKRSEENISVDFPDTKTRELLSEVAKLYNLKVKIPDTLDGSTSIKLRDVTWQQVFRVTLAPIGYDFIERNQVVEILTPAEIDNLPPEHREVEVYFQKPQLLCEYLKRIYPKQSEVIPQAHSVSITANPRYFQPILDTISRVDDPDQRLDRFPRTPYFPTEFPDFTISEQDSEKQNNRRSTQIIRLRLMDTLLVKNYIERVFPTTEKILVDYRSNTLVVTGPAKDINRVLQLAEYLDDKRWYDSPAKAEK